MYTLHVPKRFVQVSRSFKASDPGARVMLAVAGLTLAAVLVLFFLR